MGGERRVSSPGEISTADRRSVHRAGAGVVHGLVSGLVATAGMTASYGLERRLRHAGGPLDYDDSAVPSHAAMVVLGIRELPLRRQRQLGLLVHWGYGSLLGWPRLLLGRRLSPALATGVYWAVLTVMAGALFPLLGDTPAPWRWKRDVLATSLAQHLVYATVAGVIAEKLDRRTGPDAL